MARAVPGSPKPLKLLARVCIWVGGYATRPGPNRPDPLPPLGPTQLKLSLPKPPSKLTYFRERESERERENRGESMETGNGGGQGGDAQALSTESLSLFDEGISLVLSRWTAVQVAVENQWGGRDSRQKYVELGSTILSWFAQSKDPHYIDDLEDILDEYLVNYFNLELEDGSVEEVAEKLMILHEDCLKGNNESIEKLRKSVPRTNAVSQSKRVSGDDEDESSDEEEASDMMVEEPVLNERVVDMPRPKEMPYEEGWSVVAPRRNRGKRSA